MNRLSHSQRLKEFLDNWPFRQKNLKQAVLILKNWAEILPGITTNLVVREGISYSLRFDLTPRPTGRNRQICFLLDIVNSSSELFLSICFYEDEITDPEELGNAIPEGLFGETGYCFDLDDYVEAKIIYLKERLCEAYHNANRLTKNKKVNY